MGRLTQRKADDDLGHPSEDRTGRHPTDAVLRNHGYRIARRPRDGEPVWERRGVEVPQSEALRRASRDRDDDCEGA